MNESLVSVVLPIYNVEKYLDRCIESIVKQTYKNLEIILVDDGSLDRCPQICDEWEKKDPRIKAVHKDNAGLGMARNTGIEHATGDYICFIDSDDFIDLDTIEVCVNRLLADKTDIAIYGHRSVHNDGTVNSETIPRCPKETYKGKEVQDIFLPQLIAPIKGDWGIMMSAWCCCCCMKLINDKGFRFVSEREIISEDVYSLLKLYKHVQGVSVVDKPFYNYCLNESSLTHTYRKDRYEKIRHFYLESLKLCKKLEYNEDVIIALQGPYMSNTIAAIKMIAECDESFAEKKNALELIVDDDVLQNLLQSDELIAENRKKKILYWILKNKNILALYVVARLR